MAHVSTSALYSWSFIMCFSLNAVIESIETILLRLFAERERKKKADRTVASCLSGRPVPGSQGYYAKICCIERTEQVVLYTTIVSVCTSKWLSERFAACNIFLDRSRLVKRATASHSRVHVSTHAKLFNWMPSVCKWEEIYSLPSVAAATVHEWLDQKKRHNLLWGSASALHPTSLLSCFLRDCEMSRCIHCTEKKGKKYLENRFHSHNTLMRLEEYDWEETRGEKN